MKCMNSEIIHNNERYHVQTESWAPEEEVLVTQVFKSGQVVLKTKFRPKTKRDTILDAQTINKAHEEAVLELQSLFI